jgi:glycosyltransferase involved in cell wall biosynthesis
MSVCVAIPSIPTRREQLQRAVASVLAQTVPVDQISVSVDNDRIGSSRNRNRAAFAADTEWVAFLDDDDEMDPNHIEVCLRHAEKTGADLVFPWHRILRYGNPLPDLFPHRGIADDKIVPELQKSNFIPITVLVRTSVLREVGGFPDPESDEWPLSSGTDYGCWKRIMRTGAKFSHINEVTWTWHHWGWGKPGQPGNTSGKVSRW